MATAKKSAPKAAKTTPKSSKPLAAKPVAKVAVKAAAKAPAKKLVISKTAKAIASLSAKIAVLTERKSKLSADIAALKLQRAGLKTVAPAAPVAASPVKAAARKTNK